MQCDVINRDLDKEETLDILDKLMIGNFILKTKFVFSFVDGDLN